MLLIGDSAIAEHFSRVAKSNAAKDDFAVNNAADIAAIQKLQNLTAEYDRAEEKTQDLKNAGHK